VEVDGRTLCDSVGARELDPGEDVLELGPGLTTDVLREQAARLTALEIDPRLASSLQERIKNANVEVVEADAAAFFPDLRRRALDVILTGPLQTVTSPIRGRGTIVREILDGFRPRRDGAGESASDCELEGVWRPQIDSMREGARRDDQVRRKAVQRAHDRYS
jgi:hypothetical protein